MTDIGRRLHWARTSAGLSQKDLAAAVGCTSKTIRRYEKSITHPDTRMLHRLATATDTPVEILLGASTSSPGTPLASFILERDATGATRAARDAIAHRGELRDPAARVPVQIATINGPLITPTSQRAQVPKSDVEKAGVSVCSLHAAPVPTNHHRLRSMLHPVSTLLIERSARPDPLRAQLQDRRFVDGRYVVQIGPSGLQVKDLRIRANGAISVADIDGDNAFLCRSAYHHKVVIHAAVLGHVTPSATSASGGAPVRDLQQGDLFSRRS